MCIKGRQFIYLTKNNYFFVKNAISDYTDDKKIALFKQQLYNEVIMS